MINNGQRGNAQVGYDLKYATNRVMLDAKMAKKSTSCNKSHTRNKFMFKFCDKAYKLSTNQRSEINKRKELFPFFECLKVNMDKKDRMFFRRWNFND